MNPWKPEASAAAARLRGGCGVRVGQRTIYRALLDHLFVHFWLCVPTHKINAVGTVIILISTSIRVGTVTRYALYRVLLLRSSFFVPMFQPYWYRRYRSGTVVTIGTVSTVGTVGTVGTSQHDDGSWCVSNRSDRHIIHNSEYRTEPYEGLGTGPLGTCIQQLCTHDGFFYALLQKDI